MTHNWKVRLRVVGFCFWNPPRAELNFVEEIVQKRNGKRILSKTFMKLSVRDRDSRLPKQVIILIFIPLIFFALYFPSQYQWFFLSFLPFLILEIKNNCVQSHYTTRTASRVVRSIKWSPVLRGSYLDGWPKTNTPCGNFFFFSFFFSFPFEGDIKDCRTPQPCVMSFLLFLNYLFLISLGPVTCSWKGHRLFFHPRLFFFFFIRDFFLSATFFFFHQRPFFFIPNLFFYSRLLFLPRVLRLWAHVHWSRPEIESRQYGSSNGGRR